MATSEFHSHGAPRAQPGVAITRRKGTTTANPRGLLGLQRAAGNRSVAGLLGRYRNLPAEVSAQRDTTPTTPTATSSPSTSSAGPPEEQAVVTLYPIYDRDARKKIMVSSERYEQERVILGRLLRYLATAIPSDAKGVLEQYPFEEVKDMYQEVTDALTNAGQRYARGEILTAGYWAREASQFNGIEIKAHKRFLEESALSYVGKRVGLAVIGFFEGAAESLAGMVDTGAGLVGYHPDLEEKIAARYTIIKDAYSASTGIDHNLTHDAEIGRFGGKLTEALATGKALGGLGKVGMVVNATQAAAGLKSAVQAVVAARQSGKSWGAIVRDPVILAQFAGSLAGAAGVGAAGIPQLRSVLSTGGLVLNAAQMTALTTALVTYKDDPNLGEQGNFSRKAELLAGVLTSAAFIGDDIAGRSVAPTPRGPTERAPAAAEPHPATESPTPADTSHESHNERRNTTTAPAPNDAEQLGLVAGLLLKAMQNARAVGASQHGTEAPPATETSAQTTPAHIRVAQAAKRLQNSVGRLRSRLRATHLQEKLGKTADGRTKRWQLAQALRDLEPLTKTAVESAQAAVEDPKVSDLAQADVDAAAAKAEEMERVLDSIDPRTEEEVAAERAVQAEEARAEARAEASRRGRELLRELKLTGIGAAAGRSSGHGTPHKQAGAALIREGNTLPATDPLSDALKVEGRRLIDEGNAIDHRGGGIGS